jgi:hypothetical protein
MDLTDGFGQKPHLNGNASDDETAREKATFLIHASSCIRSGPVQRRSFKTKGLQPPARAGLIKIEQNVGARFPKAPLPI